MRRFVHHVGRIVSLVLLTGVAAALLVHYTPGSQVDERELNHQLGEDTLAALRAQKERSNSLIGTFAAYFRGLAHGDLGYSESNSAAIGPLLADRAPETLRELAAGLTLGWLIGLGLAIPVARFRAAWAWDASVSGMAGLMLSLPAALVAYLCWSVGAGASAVLIAVLAPRIFRFARNILVQAYAANHIQMARARGIREWTILRAHLLPAAAPQLLALFASSVTMAIGAAIPIEAICGSPGLGRLAWQAATARDLPLLVNLTMLIALATTLAMALSESANEQTRSRMRMAEALS